MKSKRTKKDKDHMIGVGARLKKIREHFKWSVNDTADKFNLSRSGYAKNEKGQALPGIRSLIKLNSKYGISLDWLLLGKGPMQYKMKIKEYNIRVEAERQQLQGSRLDKIEKELKEKELEQKERIEKEESKLLEKAEKIERYLTIDQVMPGVGELLEYMSKNPELRYRIMLNFHEHKNSLEGSENTKDKTAA